MLAPYVIVYFVYISTWKELADRYLLPIVPLLLLLAARVCVELVDLARPRARRVAVPAAVVVLAVALVLPLADSIAFDRALSGTDTREVAREWIQRNVPAGSLIAIENYGPPLVREGDARALPRGGARPGGVPPAPAQAAGAGDAGPLRATCSGCARRGWTT